MTGILQAILSFFGVTPSTSANYIEDVFSTYLYTGTGSSQTITNNIDTSTKGGLVWIKGRSGATGHRFTDTVRGATKSLESNSTAAEATESTGLTAFGTTGFTIGADADYNTNAATYVSWTFREQAKFFDVVTYTGNFVSGVGGTQTINHNLGSVPGCIIVKSVSTAGYWTVYHRELGSNKYVELNTTNQALTNTNVWNNTNPTSTQFSVGTYTDVNKSGETFVAYLFAHDAGGFGATGADNVISCGSFTTDGSGNATVNLGYEPQWVLIKASSTTSNWFTIDNMRGFSQSQYAYLLPNTSGAETSSTTTTGVIPTATGFTVGSNFSALNTTYIYIAIRRGPMKTPTSGTSVFYPLARAGTGATATVTGVGFNPDLVMSKATVSGWNWNQYDRMRGRYLALLSTSTNTEVNLTTALTGFDVQNGYTLGADATYQEINYSGYNYYNYHFGRAPGFFDVVCFTTDGSTNQRVTHNLAVVPELIITKQRNGGGGSWFTYSTTLGRSGYVSLNSTNANNAGFSDVWGTTNPTSTDFGYNTQIFTNSPYTDRTIVAYLFATVAGVSKVGSYTGTGALQTINCGFAAGARFVLIKRTDSTGDWWVYDSARGITSGNDPYLFLNSTAAEVTTTNYVDTDSTGFKVTAAAPAGLNANGGTYIFLAIA